MLPLSATGVPHAYSETRSIADTSLVRAFDALSMADQIRHVFRILIATKVSGNGVGERGEVECEKREREKGRGRRGEKKKKGRECE